MRGGEAEVDPSGPDDAGRPDLRAALGDRTMVELLSVEGVLHAVTVVRGRARLHTLTSVDEAATEAGYLRAGLRRLLQSPAAAERHERSVAATARRLDDLLFGPLELPAGPRRARPHRHPPPDRLGRPAQPGRPRPDRHARAPSCGAAGRPDRGGDGPGSG